MLPRDPRSYAAATSSNGAASAAEQALVNELLGQYRPALEELTNLTIIVGENLQADAGMGSLRGLNPRAGTGMGKKCSP